MFTQTCDYCGAVFDVYTKEEDGEMESEEYCCPECGKGYSCRASETPSTTLKSKRTDNKTDHYDNTEWLRTRGLAQKQ